MSSSYHELLPGILDVITLAYITTKLPWSAIEFLSSVSHSWQREIQSGNVHGARERSHSTETLVAIKHLDLEFLPALVDAISLYSMRDKAFSRLPQIPHVQDILQYSQFSSIGGKLHISWTDFLCDCGICSQDPPSPNARGHRKVHVIDLARQSQWEECSRIQSPQCKCPIYLGSGFVRGGKSFMRFGCTHEFDSSWRFSGPGPADKWGSEEPVWHKGEPSLEALDLDINPVQVFFVEEKEYKIRSVGARNHDIYVFDSQTKSWTHQHSISGNEVARKMEAAHALRIRSNDVQVVHGWGEAHPLTIEPLFILPVNNELLAICSWKKDTISNHLQDFFLLQSKGFGTARKSIIWERLPPYALYFGANSSFAMCPVQL